MTREKSLRTAVDAYLETHKAELFRVAVDAQLVALHDAGINGREIAVIVHRCLGERIPPKAIHARIAKARRREFKAV